MIEESMLDEIAINAKDYCLTNGLVMLDKTSIQKDSEIFKSFRTIHSPVTLFPSVYPLNEFKYATDIQNSFNELIYHVSNDYDFLKDSFKKYFLIN